MRRELILVCVLLIARGARAGRPEFVAGASYFDPAAKGGPLSWANGAITYYTDQGNLSVIMTGQMPIHSSQQRSPNGPPFQRQQFPRCVPDSLPKMSAARMSD
jgi:hypothetical protein